MRVGQYEKEVESVLNENVFVRVEDIAAVCPGLPMPTVYSKINKLQKNGKISPVGKGKYVTAPKPRYVVKITPWMRQVNDYLIDTCEGINFCLFEKDGNLIIQVSKLEMEKVLEALEKQNTKVIRKEDYIRFPLKLEGYIVLERLITESPLIDINGVLIPSLEKQLVDTFSNDTKPVDRIAFQKAVEAYPVNIDSLFRYAARRGVKEEVSALVDGLDRSRLEMMAKVQKYLSTIPVAKAWVFGSFARGEEKPSSDLDLLVDYLSGTHLSLLDVIRYKQQIESIIGREVDLIQNGYLKPFAIPSAEKDKYLIYERQGK